MLPLLLALASSSSACLSTAHENEPVTPQRPTLSSDTNTTAQGTFELEAGALLDPNDFIDTPTTLKYGAGPATEFFVGISPYQELRSRGGDAESIGDLFLGLRHRFLDETDADPSAALQATVKLPTANDSDGIGSGQIDASFAAIASKGFEELSLTAYYSLDVIGSGDESADVGHSLALAGSVPVADEFGAFGEVATQWIPEQDSHTLFTTLGMTFSPLASMTFDAGVVIGLNEEAPDFRIVFGLTRNLGRTSGQ